jgi:hypothetical protein
MSAAIKELFHGLQSELATTLGVVRKHIEHAPTKGDECELNWVGMLRDYLPARYQVAKAFVIDSNGDISDQIDVVIYDRQFSPPLFNRGAIIFVPIESVYAVFEVKQTFNQEHIAYAGRKAASVRRLVPAIADYAHTGRQIGKTEPIPILAGLLALECDWRTDITVHVGDALRSLSAEQRLDLGCCLNHGSFDATYADGLSAGVAWSKSRDTSLVYFLVRLLHRLQKTGTAPAMNYEVYGKDL